MKTPAATVHVQSLTTISMRELFKLEIDETDDTKFLTLINTIITAIATRQNFEIVKIIKIKNWFDHKWLNYSGKEVVHFESDFLIADNLALKPKWKDQITFPPFNPNRVLSSKTYSLNKALQKIDLDPIHKYQISQLNLQNRVKLKSGNILFVWFSSKTKDNKKGSLMTYELANDNVKTWYCQLEKIDEWKIGQTKNISRKELLGILDVT